MTLKVSGQLGFWVSDNLDVSPSFNGGFGEF